LSLAYLTTISAQCYEVGFDFDGDGISEDVVFDPAPMDLVENGGTTVSTINFCNEEDEVPNDPNGNMSITICSSKLTADAAPTGTYAGNFEWIEFLGCWIGTIPDGNVTPAGCGTIELVWEATENSDIDTPENCVVFNLQPSGIISGSDCFDTTDDSSAGCTYTVSFSLAVEMISFKAVKNGSVSDLNWITSSESNNEKFEIERSVDGVNFEILGHVMGAGNSTQEVKYQYTDTAPIKGINYYRLKQIDYNGVFSYSEVQSLNYDLINRTQIYPNPMVDKATVEFAVDEAELRILNLDGKLIGKYKISSGNIVDTSHLQTGVYIFTLMDLNGTELSSNRIFISR